MCLRNCSDNTNWILERDVHVIVGEGAVYKALGHPGPSHSAMAKFVVSICMASLCNIVLMCLKLW